jgi:hypothetical protein
MRKAAISRILSSPALRHVLDNDRNGVSVGGDVFSGQFLVIAGIVEPDFPARRLPPSAPRLVARVRAHRIGLRVVSKASTNSVNGGGRRRDLKPVVGAFEKSQPQFR